MIRGGILCSPRSGRHARVLLKTTAEIVLICKTDFFGDKLDFHIACRQQLFGVFNAYFGDKLYGRHIGFAVKDSA